MPTQPFGSHSPDWHIGFLLALTRHTWLGRGAARKLASGILRAEVSGPLDVRLFGQNARLYARGNHPETKALLNPSHFAPAEFAFCRSWLPRDGGVFVDIGANAGIFSLYAASLMRTGTIIAIEPIPLLFQRLSENLVSLNPAREGRVMAHLVNCAAGREPGELELFVPEQLGQASLHPLPGAERVKVPVRPLLDIVRDGRAGHIDVMKIDVEGFEDAVLGPFFRTAPDTLWPRGIILEHCHQHRWGGDIRAELIALGYGVARTDRTNTMLRRETG